jgi:hypothetical protein
MAKSSPSKSCKAWHAGDGGVGRDTFLGRMDERRGTGHLGTGTYFVSSRDRLGPAYADRETRCIPLGRARLFKPESNDAAQRLFDALASVNRTVASGDFVSEPQADERELYMTEQELEARFSTLYNRLKGTVPGFAGKSQRLSAILEQASDDYEACRRGDKEACAFDSASTRIMRAAGYDGIDVRGLDMFDNTFHGSVLYRSRKG